MNFTDWNGRKLQAPFSFLFIHMYSCIMSRYSQLFKLIFSNILFYSPPQSFITSFCRFKNTTFSHSWVFSLSHIQYFIKKITRMWQKAIQIESTFYLSIKMLQETYKCSGMLKVLLLLERKNHQS